MEFKKKEACGEQEAGWVGRTAGWFTFGSLFDSLQVPVLICSRSSDIINGKAGENPSPVAGAVIA